MVRSKRTKDLFENVLFNYEWLHAKLSSCPLQSVLADFEDASANTENKEAKRYLHFALLITAANSVDYDLDIKIEKKSTFFSYRLNNFITNIILHYLTMKTLVLKNSYYRILYPKKYFLVF